MGPDADLIIGLGLSLVAILGVSNIAFAVAWFRARDRARYLEAQAERSLEQRDPHIDRLERSVDVIAVEVERIAEMQRYSTGLLVAGQKPRDESHPKIPRSITPH